MNAMKTVLAVQVLAAFVAVAEDAEFFNVDGKGDIASLASWGSDYEALPTDKRPYLTWHSPWMTASADVTYAGLNFADYGKVLTMDLSIQPGVRTITLNNDLRVGWFTTLNLKGGLFDFQSQHTFYRGDWNQNNGNISITLNLDGCVWTNMTNVSMSYAAANGGRFNHWTLENGSALYSSGYFRFEDYHNQSRSNSVSVLSGSRMLIGDGIATDRAGANPPSTLFMTGNKFLLSGEGSYLGVASASSASKNTSFIGQNFAGSSFVITDHAKADFNIAGKNCSNIIIGRYSASAAHSNRLEVTEHADLNVNELSIGYEGTCGNVAYFGSSATFTASMLYVGRGTLANGNLCEFDSGARGFITTIYPGFGGLSASNEFRVAGGAVVTNFVTYADYSGASNNCISVAGEGSELFVQKAIYLGMSGGSYNSIRVTDGAHLMASNLYLNCGTGSTDNTLLISNATVTAYSSFRTCDSDNGNYKGGTNACIRLQGDSPRLIVSRSSVYAGDIKNGARFVFDLPPEGYAEGVVPVAMTDWRTFDKTVRFEANGIGEMLADMKAKNIRKRNIKLIETVGNVLSGLCQDNLDASNANLPDGAKFYYEGEGEYQGVPHCRSVWLEVKNPSGLMILFR